VLGGEFKRVQGTADLMPSDIVGTHIFDSSRNEFVFRRGPLFADVLLVDEINRTGPKTQSALLEAMEERQVSSERDQYPLPGDFLVLATQNPRDFEGTYPLPESQLDRFMLRIDMNYRSAPPRVRSCAVMAPSSRRARRFPATSAASTASCCTRRAPPPARCTSRRR
jgi:MoxR-like ATPase